LTPLLVGLIAALVMEPVAALLHRAVMHRRGWRWHRDHHAPARGRLEKNDLFPVVFAGLTVAVMATGSMFHSLRALLWVGAGVTTYGAAYLVVHDIGIHSRTGRPIKSNAYLRWVREAHRVHHLYGREPYGFLLPVVPTELRERADRLARDGDGRAKVHATVDSLRAVDTRARRVNTS
jgi:beta-carotene 3-hydroxylase